MRGKSNRLAFIISVLLDAARSTVCEGFHHPTPRPVLREHELDIEQSHWLAGTGLACVHVGRTRQRTSYPNWGLQGAKGNKGSHHMSLTSRASLSKSCLRLFLVVTQLTALLIISGLTTAATAATSVTISASDAAAAESGTPPTNTGTFTVNRPGNAKNDGNATVNFAISGTAGNGADYRLRLPNGTLISSNATTASVVILNGDVSAGVIVEPVDDTTPEDSETVVLTLTSVTGISGYQVGSPNTATVMIADNDTTVSISATDPNAAEAGLDPGVFTVTRTDSVGNPVDPTFPVTVNYGISGTASNGADYSLIGTSVVIPAGASSATVTITPIDDALNEGDETVTLTLASGSYNIADAPNNTATVTIQDNDPQPTVAFAAAA